MTARSKRIILILFLVFFLFVIPLLAFFASLDTGRPRGTGRLAIVLDIRGKMLEHHPHFTPGFMIGRGEITQTEVLSLIRGAADDERVEAIVLRIFQSGAGIAKCEEIAGALADFRERGKEVIAFSPIMINNHYRLACSSDSLFMPPSGYLIVTGPSSSALFLRGTLDKLGIRPNIDRIGDYKSAAEMFTETKRTPETRSMIRWVLDDLYGIFVDSVAGARGIGADTLETHIERGLFSPARALEAGLIDGVRYWDEILRRFEDDDVRIVSAREYLRRMQSGSSIALSKIAVIHAQGTIVMGESGFNVNRGPTMGSETVIRELKKAREQSSVKAVILRIDSPGGDGIAGEMISREVEITSMEKPVVVSMVDVAASGGYEIAYRADTILALPGTITGSIGSITGKFNARAFYNKIGVTKDEMGTGEKSLIFSDYRDFSPAEWDVVREEHRAFYRTWIEDIARCRGIDPEKVDSMARGRVWTGRQAADRGLIDGAGGFAEAVEAACRLAGIDSPDDVAIVHLPTRLSIFQNLFAGGYLENLVAYAVHGVLSDNLGGGEGGICERYYPYRHADYR